MVIVIENKNKIELQDETLFKDSKCISEIKKNENWESDYCIGGNESIMNLPIVFSRNQMLRKNQRAKWFVCFFFLESSMWKKKKTKLGQ